MFTRKQNYKQTVKTTYKRCSVMRDDTIHYSHSIVMDVEPLHTSGAIMNNNDAEYIEDDGHSFYQEE